MNTYNFRSPVLTRSGSAPRTICYTQSASRRSFDYQQPNNNNVTIKGNLLKRVNIKDAQDEKLFRKVSKKEEPNTNRMLVPEYLPENREKCFIRSKSSRSLDTKHNITPGNMSALIYRTDSEAILYKNRKATNPRVYKSFSFMDSEEEKPVVRNLKAVEYKKYDHTTQILSLPGGVKRDYKEINDDGKPKILKSNNSYTTKVNRDYNSNVSCLPNTLTKNKEPEKYPSPAKYRKNQSNDCIFNSNSSGNLNLFNTSHKKILNKSVKESTQEKPIVPYHKAGRPDRIRNVFASQFSII